MATADRKGAQKPTEGTPNHFKKLLEGPCLNHAFPVKHLLKDCSLMRQSSPKAPTKGSRGRNLPPLQMMMKRRMMAF